MSKLFFKFISRNFLTVICAGAILVFFGFLEQHAAFAGGQMECCTLSSACQSFFVGVTQIALQLAYMIQMPKRLGSVVQAIECAM